VFAKGQVRAFSLGTSPLQALWPLPALTLIDWVALGLIGLVSVALGNLAQPWIWNKLTWAVCGALVVLMIVGAFSIGPYVMLAALCFGLAGALAWARDKPHVGADLLALAHGGLGNLVLLFVFILFGRAQV
jgi:hypothetical protein